MNLNMFRGDKSITCQTGMMHVHINTKLSACPVVTSKLAGHFMFCNTLTFLGTVSVNILCQ